MHKEENEVQSLSKLAKNKHFCVMPFTHQYVTTTGSVNLCCIADWANPVEDRIMNLDASWRSNTMQTVRAGMLADRPEPRCTLCYSQGAGSDRVQHNTRYAQRYPDMKLNTVTGNDTDNPLWLDLRPGRLCNLKCRMCFSDISSSVAEELAEHPELAQLIGDTPQQVTDWLDDPGAFQSVTRVIPHIGVLKLAGGEPLFMPGVLRLLRWMIDTGHTDVHLDITTNGTRLQGKTYRLLEHFRKDIQFSVDGVGAVNDYIRTGADWSQLNTAYNSYGNMANTRVHVMVTAQLYNIFNLHAVCDWWNGDWGNIVINPVNWPQDLSIDLLDTEGRDLAGETLAGPKNFLPHSSRLQHILDRIHSAEPDNVAELRSQWVKRTELQDHIRGTDAGLLHPLFQKYITEWR